ncbi:MAG TPA: YvcK family protein [Thermoanaerobaculaceae bacterium]|nr:YvcK family protein [Thermoanaerobaculaceae bacterium]HRS15909.1 YvcK family protein [Thermoanaerobaculaceae bacterium]
MDDPSTGPRVVALGGGTGLATLLRAVKRLPLGSLSAVVTVSDDGGSSGRLRQEYDMPPPGDVRNCLVALAQDDELLTRLFALRLPGDGPTGGHPLGNLFMTALHHLTGDFPRAVRLAAEVLRVRGTVLPATGDTVTLLGEGPNGEVLAGETAISHGGPPRRVWLEPADPRALPEALAAVAAAETIVIGPGSLYTSLIPNLLVPGLREAVVRAPARKVYIANLVTQPGETDGFDLEKHLAELARYAPGLRLDVVVLNTRPLPPDVAALYAAAGAELVRSHGTWHGPGVLLQRDLLAVTGEGTVRHSQELLAATLGEVLGVEPGRPAPEAGRSTVSRG